MGNKSSVCLCYDNSALQTLVDKSLNTSVPLLFPMYLVKVSDLLLMTEVKPHQVLLKEGIVVQYERGMRIIFISHQWVGNGHPDPHCEQLQILIDAFNNMIAGNIKVEADIISQLFFQRFLSMSKEEMASLIDAYVWYDFFSIPQMQERTEAEDDNTESDLQHAVDSIPSYVEMADYFMILAPPTMHWKGHICDYRSWRSRGWCRLEQTAQILLQVGMPDTILIQGSENVDFISPKDWLFDYAVHGDFAVESDRERVNQLVDTMVSIKVKKELHADNVDPGQLFFARWIQASRNRFCGIGNPNCHSSVNDVDVDAFLQKYLFNAVTDLPAPFGMGPLFFALIEGDLALADKLVAKGADVHAKVLQDISQLIMLPGGNMLNTISFHTQSVPVSQWCVDHGMDINAKNAKGAGNVFRTIKPDLLKWFYSHPRFDKAHWTTPEQFGCLPLDYLVFFEAHDVVNDLLSTHQADVDNLNGVGRVAIFNTVAFSSPQMTSMVLEASKDMTAVGAPTSPFTFMGGLIKTCEIALSLSNDRFLLTKWLGNYRDSNCLHEIVITNKFDVAPMVLEFAQKHGSLKALLHTKNHRGLTPLDMAKQEKRTILIKFLEQAEVHVKDPDRFPLPTATAFVKESFNFKSRASIASPGILPQGG